MGTNTARKPVSENTLELVLNNLKAKKMIPGFLGMKKGQGNQIIFETSDGEVPCNVTESDVFICLELPSGRALGIPKVQFTTN